MLLLLMMGVIRAAIRGRANGVHVIRVVMMEGPGSGSLQHHKIYNVIMGL